MNTRQVSDPLAALLAKEQRVRDQILDPNVTEVDTHAFCMDQLGLKYPLVGKDGRLWVQDNSEPYHIKVIYDPNKPKG